MDRGSEMLSGLVNANGFTVHCADDGSYYWHHPDWVCFTKHKTIAAAKQAAMQTLKEKSLRTGAGKWITKQRSG